MKYLSYFEESLSVLKRRENIEEMLNWIVCNRSSFEKWIQYEFGYSLNKLLQNEDMYVYPEKNRIDLPICRLGNPDEIYVKTELKTISNWYTRVGQFDNIRKDIEKINRNDVPSYLIVFYFHAIPKKGIKLTEWMVKQIKNGTGIEEMEEFKEAVSGGILTSIKEINPSLKYGPLDTKIVFSNEYFDTVELAAYWVYADK